MNNNTILRGIYLFINIIIFAGLAAFCYFNMDKTAEYFCPLMQKTYTTHLIFLVSMIFAAAYVAGYAACSIFKQKLSDKCNAYEKRHENISVANESDKARIQTLEAKIETLETALKNALENK